MKLITDRTQADVLLGNEKGRYGYADLNRVEQAVAELCQLAQRLDIHMALQIKTDWDLPGTFSVQSWPTESQMERFLRNVKDLCHGLSLQVSLPETMERLDVTGANRIEKALEKADLRVQSILQTYHYSGECYAGEENSL